MYSRDHKGMGKWGCGGVYFGVSGMLGCGVWVIMQVGR